MARVDDFIGARRLAAETLSARSTEAVARSSEFELIEIGGERRFRVPYLDRCYRILPPTYEMVDPETPEKEIPLQEQVLILHYMLGAASASEKADKTDGNGWIAYREIPGANLYFGPFTSRAVNPLKKVYGNRLDAFRAAAVRLNGVPVDFGDAGFEFPVFPKAPIRLILWEGDEDFAPEANILFQKRIGDILSPEDVAWHASLLVYRLISLGG